MPFHSNNRPIKVTKTQKPKKVMVRIDKELFFFYKEFWFSGNFGHTGEKLSTQKCDVDFAVKEAMRKALEDGITLKEIGEINLANLEKKHAQAHAAKKYNLSMKQITCGAEDGVEFRISWILSIGICMKLKLIKDDEANGIVIKETKNLIMVY